MMMVTNGFRYIAIFAALALGFFAGYVLAASSAAATLSYSDSVGFSFDSNLHVPALYSNFAFIGTGSSPGVLTVDGNICLNGSCITSWSTGGSSLWLKNGNDIYYKDGKVGIGTDSPAASLHVFAGGSCVADSSVCAHIQSDVDCDNTPGCQWYDGCHAVQSDCAAYSDPTSCANVGGACTWVSDNAARFDGNVSVNGAICLNGSCITSWSTGGSSLWLKNGNDIYYKDGKVGIGTDSPTAQLHVIGDANITGILYAGYLSVLNDVYVHNSLSTTNADVSGTLATANLKVSGDANVDGVLRTGSLAVSGDANFSGNINADGDLTVKGKLWTSSDATVAGTLTATDVSVLNDANVSGSLYVSRPGPSWICVGDICFAGPLGPGKLDSAVSACARMGAHLCSVGEYGVIFSSYIKNSCSSGTYDESFWTSDPADFASDSGPYYGGTYRDFMTFRVLYDASSTSPGCAWDVINRSVDTQQKYFCCKYIGAIYNK